MDFAYSDHVQRLQGRLRDFMHEQVLPANPEWQRLADAGEFPLAIVDDLKAKAEAHGSCNLLLRLARPRSGELAPCYAQPRSR